MMSRYIMSARGVRARNYDPGLMVDRLRTSKYKPEPEETAVMLGDWARGQPKGTMRRRLVVKMMRKLYGMDE